jgi:hypothetical protein
MLLPAVSPAEHRWVRLTAWTLLAALLAPGGLAKPRTAEARDAVQTILIDTLYGGAAGLLLGGVLMLVVDENSRDDTLRWGVVLGTFSGFGYGVYEVQKGLEEYSTILPRIASPGRRESGGGVDARLAAWADSLRLTPHAGSALSAALAHPSSPAVIRAAARSGYGRDRW